MTQNGRDLGTKFTTLRPNYFFFLSISLPPLYIRPAKRDNNSGPRRSCRVKTRYSRHDSAKTFFRRRCLRPEGEGLSRDPASLHPHSPEITTFPVLSSNKFILDIYKYWKEKEAKKKKMRSKYIYID